MLQMSALQRRGPGAIREVGRATRLISDRTTQRDVMWEPGTPGDRSAADLDRRGCPVTHRTVERDLDA
jgi:hypothetical protein